MSNPGGAVAGGRTRAGSPSPGPTAGSDGLPVPPPAVPLTEGGDGSGIMAACALQEGEGILAEIRPSVIASLWRELYTLGLYEIARRFAEAVNLQIAALRGTRPA